MRAPLGCDDLEQFVDRGWVALRQAFPRAVAEEVRPMVASGLRCDFDRPGTWTSSWDVLRETYTEAPFMDAVTDHLPATIDQLAGPGRWEPLDFIGWWPVAFPGFAKPPRYPGWHVDGELEVGRE